MRGGSLRGYLTVSLFLVTATPAAASPGVQVKQEANGSVHAEAEAQPDKQPSGDPTPFIAPAQPSGEHGDADKHGAGGEQEGTEFWPTLFGYKVKITDSLIALSTLALTVFTGLLWRSTEKLWASARVQGDDMKKSIAAAELAGQVAKDSLIAGQRAWIKVSEISFHEGLYIRQNDARTTITFKLTNVGNAPALRIAPWIRLGVVRVDATHLIKFNLECEVQRFPPPFEMFLFPGDSFPDIDNQISFPASISGVDFEAGFHEDADGKHFMPLITGCIFYQFPSDPGKYHQTRFVSEISRKDFQMIRVGQQKAISKYDLAMGKLSWEESHYAD